MLAKDGRALAARPNSMTATDRNNSIAPLLERARTTASRFHIAAAGGGRRRLPVDSRQGDHLGTSLLRLRKLQTLSLALSVPVPPPTTMGTLHRPLERSAFVLILNIDIIVRRRCGVELIPSSTQHESKANVLVNGAVQGCRRREKVPPPPARPPSTRIGASEWNNINRRTSSASMRTGPVLSRLTVRPRAAFVLWQPVNERLSLGACPFMPYCTWKRGGALLSQLDRERVDQNECPSKRVSAPVVSALTLGRRKEGRHQPTEKRRGPAHDVTYL